MYVHYFFVPYRILDEYWEEIITGGVDGNSVRVPPVWIPQDTDLAAGSLWDFLGFPIIGTNATYPQHSRPVVYPKRAYNMIYNEYYRDETLQAKVDINLSNVIKLRNWSKDYFTSSLPWQQRGTAPALPITGTTHAVFNASNFLTSAAPSPQAVQFRGDMITKMAYVQSANGVENFKQFLNDNTVDLASASTFNVSDLRLAFQVQRWMERNARAGVRYTEFLRAHFNVSPRDDRLQRPEYIGGSKAPIIFSEVLQTSQTGTTPQGNMSGHGITASSKYCGSYHAQEFGLIMGIMSIMPVPAYNCQGIDRQWLKPTRYDYYFPEFANLSEQAIRQ